MDKQYPLEERFDIWEKYCDKEEKCWVIGKGKFEPIGSWVEERVIIGDYIERHQKYDYDYFLDAVYEAFHSPNSSYNRKDNQRIRDDVGSYDNFFEILIETNFGSFIFDW